MPNCSYKLPGIFNAMLRIYSNLPRIFTCPEAKCMEAVEALGKVDMLRVLEWDGDGLQQVQH